MYTINVKGTPNPREPKKVIITIIFHQTGYCRAKKVLNITGLLSEWDQNKQCFRIKNSEYQVKNNMISELILKYIKVADEWEKI